MPATSTARGVVFAFVACMAPMISALSLGFTSPAESTMLGNLKTHPLDVPPGNLKVFDDPEGAASWFSSIVNIGALVGAFAGGPLCATIGHANVLRIVAALIAISWFGIFFADDASLLVALRVPIGLGVGLQSVACPALISQVSPPHLRGTLGTANAGSILVGVLIIQFVGGTIFRTGDGGEWCEWRGLALFVVAFASCACAAAFVLPGPPKQELHPGVPDVTEEQREISRSFISDNAMAALPWHSYWRPMLGGIVPMVWQNLSGTNTIVFFGQTILAEAGVKNADEVGPTVIAVQLAGIVIAAAVIERLGRRPLLLLSSFIVSVSALGLGLLISAEEPVSWAVVLAMYSYVLAFAVGLGPVPWLLLPELGLPAHLRIAMASVATAANWGASFAVTGPPLNAIQGKFGLNGVFFCFSGITFVGFLLMLAVVPETKQSSQRRQVKVDQDCNDHEALTNLG